MGLKTNYLIIERLVDRSDSGYALYSKINNSRNLKYYILSSAHLMFDYM